MGTARKSAAPKGSIKFWVKDGVLVQYEIKVKGTISFTANDRTLIAPHDRNQGHRHDQVGIPDEADEENVLINGQTPRLITTLAWPAPGEVTFIDHFSNMNKKILLMVAARCWRRPAPGPRIGPGPA